MTQPSPAAGIDGDVSPVITVQHASVRQRLHDVCVSGMAGELIHLIGPNGAGKSTLLAYMAGVLSGQGTLSLLGQPMAGWSARDMARVRAYLPQQHAVQVLMPVFQYLQLHQPPHADSKQVDGVVHELAERLLLREKLARPLNQLSGGEWQRVRLAAVFLQIWPTLNPAARLLLLDEPAASLDIGQRVALDSLLAEVCRYGIAAVVSGHDLNHTLHHADRVWLMEHGQLIAHGPTVQVMQPERLSQLFGVAFSRYTLGDRYWMLARQEIPADDES
ncbi:vitamin B12 ABC transporter ATP-binding protein BtuD [Dickeya lacustris]|uniref:Vitamin B12 import ATP-binding protein BtuD n=1 Tax=Dickeya lacustris TaxID=2259638 RepID=A0ABY8G964_9GAMM|nr:vitamin B12 ABC transporter ATP-binding protein BtuD [Dickeya lacustris]WFN56496.1 vitamin B12 ABC transporter ATP-binding protein BtuD [Dickeya lacustris]